MKSLRNLRGLEKHHSRHSRAVLRTVTPLRPATPLRPVTPCLSRGDRSEWGDSVQTGDIGYKRTET
jgi:phage gp46-like protein